MYSLGSATPDDAAVVANLMSDIINTFGHNWLEEQEKHKMITARFKADVPLLVLTPRPWWDACMSCQTLGVIGIVMWAFLSGGLIAAMLASAVAHMDAAGLAALMLSTFAIISVPLWNIASWQFGNGVPLRRILITQFFLLSSSGITIISSCLLMPLNARWCQNQLHIVIIQCNIEQGILNMS